MRKVAPLQGLQHRKPGAGLRPPGGSRHPAQTDGGLPTLTILKGREGVSNEDRMR